MGAGPSKADLQALIHRLSIESSVRLVPYTLDTRGYYEAADAQILLSKYEGFGLVILEGFAVSTPIISTPALFGPKQLVEEGINGLVVEPTEQSVAAAMSKILGNNDLRLRLAAGARATAAEYSEQSWSRGWRTLLALEG